MTAERRPGGWVDGIGWVALLHALATDDQVKPGHHQPSRSAREERLYALWNYPVQVVRWADGTTPTAPAPHVEDMPEWDALVERWKASLADARLGWIVDDEGKSWPPHGSHRGTCGHPHIYDGGCAICRAGDQAEALDALLRFLAADLIAWEATR